MKQYSSLRLSICVLVLLAIFTLESSAQAERVVPIASGDGVIESTVLADSLGRQANPNTVYELERDGYYTVFSPISNPSFHLHIRAAAGTGKKPIVRPYAGTSRCFAPTGNLTLEGVYVNALDAGGTLRQNSVRTAAGAIRIVITDCHFDRDLQSVLRVESAMTKWFVTRSYFSNLGLMADNNGRMWDDRGNNVDTVIIEDNVIYNLTGRLTRDGGGIINYFRFNHNTCVNVFDRPIAIGDAKEAYVTNNLFVNTYFKGDDTLSSYQVNVLPYTGGGTQILRVHHNNFYTTPAMLAAYSTTNGPRGVVLPQTLYDTLATRLMTESGDVALNTELPVSFIRDPSDSAVGPMRDYWNNGIPVGSKRNMYAGPDSGRGSWDSIQVPWDFRYSVSNPLYTSGVRGYPIGALFIWDIIDDIDQNAEFVPAAFELSQNFPNPFNPTTVIQYSLHTSGLVTLTVHNILGQEVAMIVNGKREAGVYTESLDARTLPSGMYLYTLTVDGFSATKKMSLLK